MTTPHAKEEEGEQEDGQMGIRGPENKSGEGTCIVLSQSIHSRKGSFSTVYGLRALELLWKVLDFSGRDE